MINVQFSNRIVHPALMLPCYPTMVVLIFHYISPYALIYLHYRVYFCLQCQGRHFLIGFIDDRGRALDVLIHVGVVPAPHKIFAFNRFIDHICQREVCRIDFAIFAGAVADACHTFLHNFIRHRFEIIGPAFIMKNVTRIEKMSKSY